MHDHHPNHLQSQVSDGIPDIDPADYHYALPPDRIASRPAGRREDSRLLVIRRGTGVVKDDHFARIVEYLPAKCLLVLNTTRVVRARLHFQRATGGRIEVLLLEPILPSTDPSIALSATGSIRWRAMIGGARKARRLDGISMDIECDGHHLTLAARFFPEAGSEWDVEFQWSNERITFADILRAVGSVPLPPYLNRPPDHRDDEDYQTVYATHEGAVAAPTAGLHFTESLLRGASDAGCEILSLDLHVGAGTFRPISGSVRDHRMHRERIVVPRRTIQRLLEMGGSCGAKRPVVAVGTTAMRVIESLYWLGTRLLRGEEIHDDLLVRQWDPYRHENVRELPLPADALGRVLQHLNDRSVDELNGGTELMIVPGYRFALCDGLITNFHQPGSTLILLVAAFLGDSIWRSVYEHALGHDYRFLSYGDASLILPSLDD